VYSVSHGAEHRRNDERTLHMDKFRIRRMYVSALLAMVVFGFTSGHTVSWKTNVLAGVGPAMCTFILTYLLLEIITDELRWRRQSR
jgi:ABC-type thiamin/hydroxymethylpyrimidine transport system permease subunit